MVKHLLIILNIALEQKLGEFDLSLDDIFAIITNGGSNMVLLGTSLRPKVKDLVIYNGFKTIFFLILIVFLKLDLLSCLLSKCIIKKRMKMKV